MTPWNTTMPPTGSISDPSRPGLAAAVRSGGQSLATDLPPSARRRRGLPPIITAAPGDMPSSSAATAAARGQGISIPMMIGLTTLAS